MQLGKPFPDRLLLSKQVTGDSSVYDPPHSYPLQWPSDRPRTPSGQRRRSTFSKGGKRLTIHAATERLKAEISRVGGTLPVLSTNIESRQDGLPRSDGRPLNGDPGVCLYFQHKGRPIALSEDIYTTVEDNIAGIAKHIEATRAIERYGVGSVEQMFQGFQAIRGPGVRPWREVLGIRPETPINRQGIRARVTELAKQHHPDVPGGNHARMAEINEAADRAMADVA